MTKIRVLLVDDHELMRQLFRELISQSAQIEIVGEAANGRDAVAQAGRLEPDVVLMDISMPVMDGIEATGIIKSRHPNIHVVGLTMHDRERLADSVDEAGMDAVVNKCSTPTDLLTAIMAFRNGK